MNLIMLWALLSAPVRTQEEGSGRGRVVKRHRVPRLINRMYSFFSRLVKYISDKYVRVKIQLAGQKIIRIRIKIVDQA